MSFKLKKITGNQLFTPAILLLSVLIGFYISSIDLVEKNYSFSFILAMGGIILILKTFVTIFGSLEINLKDKKSLLSTILIILGIIQFYLGFLAINFLRVDKFPQNTVTLLLAAQIIFSTTTFLTKNLTLLRFSLFTNLLLILSSTSLYFKLFVESPDLFILLQQFIAYIVLITQLIELFLTMGFYSKNRVE